MIRSFAAFITTININNSFEASASKVERRVAQQAASSIIKLSLTQYCSIATSFHPAHVTSICEFKARHGLQLLPWPNDKLTNPIIPTKDWKMPLKFAFWTFNWSLGRRHSWSSYDSDSEMK
ncbi:hypothetical protein AC578_10143 [Pseudocercospora eumusae]|uniref:Uncharacterized protein n=1 Tax=Pseudocercospora eumusae TaxID=321146 RepID=A0A139HYS6_9PEZI|nr:hypothetical protein AC578_10143 [Pseudocercospora eumusae]